MDIQNAMILQGLLDLYNTGSEWARTKPEDSMSMFPSYSEAENMLNRKARAKKGMSQPDAQSTRLCTC